MKKKTGLNYDKKFCGVPTYFLRKPIEQDETNPLWLQKLMRIKNKKI